jgi:hypothetical protein
MNAQQKKKVIVFVGSGFSAALTGGDQAPIGNKPLPTLSTFSRLLSEYISNYSVSDWSNVPFSIRTHEEAIRLLDEKLQGYTYSYNFEELISILAIEKTLASNGVLQNLREKDAFDNQLLDCLIFFIPRLLADRIALDGELKRNRNIFYAVKDGTRVRAMQDKIWNFCDSNDVTFVSFNYDGLLEAFLDCKLSANKEGEKPVFRYFPQFSHGIPMVMPEHALGHDMRDFARIKREMPSSPRVLKPHGSMHFYTARPEVSHIANIPRMLALHPRFDISFDPKTMQRDIPDSDVWDFINPVPFIIPPVINKDVYLSADYSRHIMGEIAKAFTGADYIVSLGFSIPRSDLYMSALLQLLRKGVGNDKKKIALVWKQNGEDRTLKNWENIFGADTIGYKVDTGLAVDTPGEIDTFWDGITGFLSS